MLVIKKCLKLGKKGPVCQNSYYTLHTLNFTQLSCSLTTATIKGHSQS